jgi:hypothetical protein
LSAFALKFAITTTASTTEKRNDEINRIRFRLQHFFRRFFEHPSAEGKIPGRFRHHVTRKRDIQEGRSAAEPLIGFARQTGDYSFGRGPLTSLNPMRHKNAKGTHFAASAPVAAPAARLLKTN